MENKIFGRVNAENNQIVDVLYSSDGTVVTRISGATTVYPINSSLSAAYEHANGIQLSIEDAQKLGLEIE